MAIEEKMINEADQNGPSEYIADIGKGVLLANAKIKLLEEFVGSTSSDVCSSIQHELSSAFGDLQESAGNQHTDTKVALNQLSASLNTIESKLVSSIATSREESSNGITDLNEALALAQKSLSQAIAEAEKHVKDQASDYLLKEVAAIQKNRDLLQQITQEHNATTIKQLDGLEIRIKNVLRAAEQSITQRCMSLASGQDVMRKWLLGLSIAVVLLSGTSICLLAAILTKSR